ncbi:MAG: T9SS type A sorting domain-containing protein, partial [Bacteroidetes bacterium]|nr:T9SS type A sorting domain-containing protein [Bacteroidota bacterium]
RIVTDPVTMNKDIVYAACYGAIMRSEDGGQTWTMVLGDLVNKSFCSDIAITSNGTLYAVLSGYGWSIEPPGKKGIWRSTNGINWTEITPRGFPTQNRTTKLAIAPSDESVMFVFTESQSPDLNPFNGYTNSVNTFWKMKWSMSGDSAVWENRTPGIPGHGNGDMNSWPFALVVYGGYCVSLGVMPNDANKVFLGGMSLFRSDNGFADSLHISDLGGCPYDMDSLHAIHPDQHGIAFLPSNPNTMFMSNDGGIYRTFNCLADSAHISWDRQNARLTTTQFYSVGIDHGASAEDYILGGLQDNNWYYTVTDNPSEFWFNIDICYDGFAVAVAPSWEYCVISAYSGNIWTSRFDANMHTKDIYPQLPDTLLKYYDPVMGSNALFPFYQNFALDPNNSRTFYLPTINSIWRKDDLKASAMDSSKRNAGWNHLSNVDIGNASVISALSVSHFPANRLYYGTSLGKLYRLDNANTGNPLPVDITGSNFPAHAFIACIDINPLNADGVMVVFSNYGVKSLFLSADGGATWTSVSGNLEEHPDGTGSGPSVRWAKVLNYQGDKVVFAGTSVGLFSTTKLNGDSTTWVQESPDSIGNVIVDMIDARSTDGFVAVATHGNGVYSCYYKPTAGISEPGVSRLLDIGDPYPIPARDVVTVPVKTTFGGPLEMRLTSNTGVDLGIVWKGNLIPGRNNISIQLSSYPVSPGIYYLTATSSSGRQTKKIIVTGNR